MTKTKIVAAAAAIVAVAAVIGSVQAHQWGGPRHHGMMHKASMHGDWRGHRGGHYGGKWMCGMAKHIDGRLAFLKTELKITPEQEKLWEDFATVAKDNATSMQERCAAKKAKWKDAKEKGEGKERPPLPERLDARAELLEAKLEALRAKTNAVKPLYDALNDEQKKTADELIRG
jgi:LTXXQ motif family protein